MANICDKKKLNIIEIFRSVQGETDRAGLLTTFVRLARCNLRCSWCDTTYSFTKGTENTLLEIISQVESFHCPYVCITGGEPLLQKNVYDLMQKLCDLNYSLSIETGGSLSIQEVDPRVQIILDVKCPGSGMHTKNLWKNLALLKANDSVKFVILDQADYQYAKKICYDYNLFNLPIEILFSPVHEKLCSQSLVVWLLEDALPTAKIRLNLQIHKFIWSPETKGV